VATGEQNELRERRDFTSSFNAYRSFQGPRAKIFLSVYQNRTSVFQKYVIVFAHPASARGALRPIVTKRGARDAMDALDSRDE
jgi:hypothetical protein